MRAPVTIFEEGRINITYYDFKPDGSKAERHLYRATFLVLFRNEKNTHTLCIDTDSTFTYAFGFSLDQGRMKSGDDRPEWLYLVLRTFNEGGRYDEAIERELRLICLNPKSDEGCHEYCYQLTQGPVRCNNFLVNRPVNGLSFKDTITEEPVTPEKAKPHYSTSRLFKLEAAPTTIAQKASLFDRSLHAL